MENGTAAVPSEDGATSGTSDDIAIKAGEQYSLYVVWPAGPVFLEPRGASENWKWAKREAQAIGGLVTKQQIVGDFRRPS